MTRIADLRTGAAVLPAGRTFDAVDLHRAEHERLLRDLRVAAARRRPRRLRVGRG